MSLCVAHIYRSECKSEAARCSQSAAKYDFRLLKDSPAINAGVAPGKFGDFDLTPKLQYVHPHEVQPRPADAKLDVRAFEFVPEEQP